MPSPLKLMTDRAFDAFTPKGVVISKSEKPVQVYQKEDDLPKGLPKEATVLGTIQILCFLVISSLGVILVYAPSSPQLSPAISTILMSGYPFLGALCGVLVVMLTFTVLELLAAAYASVFWWKRSTATARHSSSRVGRTGALESTHAHSDGSLLEFLKGEPKVLGFIITGCLTGASSNDKCMGILSVLLIISIAELSIAVTIASFRSNCWANSNEIVFFLPSDATQESELSVPDENAVIQFELQEESTSADSVTNIKPVFFGGYSFFKLRVTKNQFAFHHAGRRGSDSFNTSSLFMEDERQKYVPQTASLYGEDVEAKHSPPVLEEESPEIMMNTEPLKDEDLHAAITQSPEEKTPLLQDQASKLQLFPSYSVKSVHSLLLQDLPSQASRAETSPEQDLLSEASSHGITSQDKQSQGISLQNTQSHDMLSDYLPAPDMPAQDLPFQRQALPLQAIPFGATSLLSVQSPTMQHLDQRSLDFQLHNVQSQEQRAVHLSYQDIKSEVMLMTEEWKPGEELQSRRPSKQHSQLQQSKGCPCARQKAPDMYSQDQPPPRRKSLDKHIRGWLSPKKQYIDKEIQAVQILFGVMNFSFGIVLLFTLEDPYPRFPFIFISGYPFWSSVLVTLSRIMSALSALAAATGIFLLVIGFLIDRDFLCGYAGEVSECYAVTTLFIEKPDRIVDPLVPRNHNHASEAIYNTNCREGRVLHSWALRALWKLRKFKDV
ncbi:hypothetical protein MJT46_010450 [Ovis ammon polii x Ovis aries]|nr:hypothetical protein MJT46_010450 [Ovis ammon polii x Ovis aries]